MIFGFAALDDDRRRLLCDDYAVEQKIMRSVTNTRKQLFEAAIWI